MGATVHPPAPHLILFGGNNITKNNDFSGKQLVALAKGWLFGAALPLQEQLSFRDTSIVPGDFGARSSNKLLSSFVQALPRFDGKFGHAHMKDTGACER